MDFIINLKKKTSFGSFRAICVNMVILAQSVKPLFKKHISNAEWRQHSIGLGNEAWKENTSITFQTIWNSNQVGDFLFGRYVINKRNSLPTALI